MSIAVGICSAVEQVRWGAWDQTVAMVPRAYASAAQRAGALALVLPPDDEAAEHPDALLDRVDALILAGGADVDAASYGARPHPETKGTWPERDRFELGLTHRALERDMPVLGICRGMQLLNVACGGTLEQNLADSHVHIATPGRFTDHPVRLEAGSLAARVMGEDLVEVRSHHHQGIGRLGEGLVVSGWAEPGDVIEAIEMPEKTFVLGVIWHPEEHRDSRALRALADAARHEVAA